ncbi:ROK family transcriptional regulator [Vibrio sp. JPW-9-11-11]|uniref:ROK family transcriptional regulator n=1 Tax=Vibrio sp. JPW-9-11-11 TaxID=1416532 RepID=UPI0015946567|nr:ROK family transcriptional regulator [Vibrio sp. JPW-9-11-11]NVD06474.1 ROK family transcriptional regulator [Vibrio sp. JPW-9-11-11]
MWLRQGVGLANSAIRVHNKRAILTHLAKSGPLSKSELALRTQLSIPAVSKILSDLDAESKIMLHSENVHGRGNSAGMYALSNKHDPILCLNVSPKKIVALIVAADFQLLVPLSEYEIDAETPKELIDAICDVYASGLKASKQRSLRIAIGLHGKVDKQSGASLHMPLANWQGGFECRYLLAQRLGTEVMVENDCVGLALAEKWQSQRSEHFCVVNLDFGIGSAFIVDEQVSRGRSHSNGEIGHTLVDIEGQRCGCGQTGCLETVASLSALQKAWNDVLQQGGKGNKSFIDAVVANHPQAMLLSENAVNAIGRTLSNCLNLVEVEQIVLYGRLCALGDAWLTRIRDTVCSHPFYNHDNLLKHQTQVMFGELSLAQQTRGLAYLYIEQSMNQDGVYRSLT